MAMLGALLALAPELLYSPELCLGAFGVERLDDQRLGGALMATLGSLPYLAGALFLVHRLLAGEPVPARGAASAKDDLARSPAA
jgi:putative membrane protein